MHTLNELNHHAYVITGSVKKTKVDLIHFLNKKGIKTEGNPDFWISEYDNASVEDIRGMIDLASRHAVNEDGKRYFVLVLNEGISHSGQNALLKILEEPNLGSHFFILISSSSNLLPTVLSRVHVLKDLAEGESEKELSENVTKFLKSGIPSRLEMVKSLLSDLSDENITFSDIENFVNEIEKQSYQKIKSLMNEDSKLEKINNVKTLETILLTQNYLRDPSSSTKILLESLALNLPKI